MKNCLRSTCLILLFILLFAFASCDAISPAKVKGEVNGGLLTVSFLDVGQGDCSFIELPDGKCMLIDAGEDEYSSAVIGYIRTKGYSRIDYVIATHPHSDHIGGMADVAEYFDIGDFYMPDVSGNSAIFENMLDSLIRKNIRAKKAEEGTVVCHSPDYSVSFLSPVPGSIESDDLNDSSAVCRIVYGSTSFLFMADAGKKVENLLNGNLNADVVKIGHHGSESSSGEEFIRKTDAEYGVIQVGIGNRYGHPEDRVLADWRANGTKVLRTDLCGNIVFVSDGTKLSYTTGKSFSAEETEDAVSDEKKDHFILNTQTKKYHLPSCRYAVSMKEENREISYRTQSELVSLGYSECSVCLGKGR